MKQIQTLRGLLVVALCAFGGATAAHAQNCQPTWIIPGGANEAVETMYVLTNGQNPGLYVGGDFSLIGGVTATRIARFNGVSWSQAGNGLTAAPLALTESAMGGTHRLVAVGNSYLAAGSSGTSRVVVRLDNDGVWRVFTPYLPTGWLGWVAEHDDGSGPALYVSGGFALPPSDGYIARWRGGSAWEPVGPGLVSVVHDSVIAEDSGGDSSLYITGSFITDPPESARFLARWDGDAFRNVGGGLSSVGNAIARFDDGRGDAFYVGGSFFRVGVTGTQTDASNIARWNGASWEPLGAGLNREVTALAVWNDGTGEKLVAAGQFTMSGSQTVRGLAAWDGNSWRELGGGITGGIARQLAVFDPDGAGPMPALLAVGGTFSQVGGQPAGNIAFLAPAVSRGDLNCDCHVDNFDIDAFVLALSDETEYESQHPACDRTRGDVNGDGRVDNFDIDAFIALLSGG